jgi:hypothetical protein
MTVAEGIVGVSDHWGWAVLVTAARDGRLLDRRRVDLVDAGLPKYPHHYEGPMLPVEEAVALVERVRASAIRHAQLQLESLAMSAPCRIRGIAIRECPQLPETVAERIRDYRAHNVADSVLYRQALAGAAEGRGWAVHWYHVKKALRAAGEALRVKDLDAHFEQIRRSAGPPWSKDHKVAMAAAIASANGE